MLIAAFDFTFEDKLYRKGTILLDSFSNLAGAKWVDKIDLKQVPLVPEIKKIEVPEKQVQKVEVKKVEEHHGRGRPKKG